MFIVTHCRKWHCLVSRSWWGNKSIGSPARTETKRLMIHKTIPWRNLCNDRWRSIVKRGIGRRHDSRRRPRQVLSILKLQLSSSFLFSLCNWDVQWLPVEHASYTCITNGSMTGIRKNYGIKHQKTWLTMQIIHSFVSIFRATIAYESKTFTSPFIIKHNFCRSYIAKLTKAVPQDMIVHNIIKIFDIDIWCLRGRLVTFKLIYEMKDMLQLQVKQQSTKYHVFPHLLTLLFLIRTT